MIENLIILILLTILFALGLIKSINGLYIIIFLIPYQGLSMKGIDLSIMLIFTYFLGYIYDNKRFSIRGIPYKKYINLLILIFIISIGVFIFKGRNSDFLLYPGWSVEHALFHYIKPFIASILFFILTNNIIQNRNQLIKSISFFTLSIFYYSFTWFFDFILHLPIPSFLKTTYYGSGESYNSLLSFSGYTGESGLTSEYCLFIFILSLYLIVIKNSFGKKCLYCSTLLLALLVGISTSMKTFIVGIFLILLFYIYFYLRKAKLNLYRNMFYMFMTFILLFFTYYRITQSYLVHRVIVQQERIQYELGSEYLFDRLIHRPYQGEFNDFLEVSGLIGIGPINALGVRENHLATHSHYFDLFMKFGLIGLLLYLLFYFRMFKDLYKLNLKKNNMPFPNKLLVFNLFTLFFVLFLAEYARSYQNQTSFMLSYWFLFALIASITKRNVLSK